MDIPYERIYLQVCLRREKSTQISSMSSVHMSMDSQIPAAVAASGTTPPSGKDASNDKKMPAVHSVSFDFEEIKSYYHVLL